MDAVLVMFKADGQRREFPITRPVTVMGRKHNCDLRVPISSVSREHCQIERDGDAIMLRDLGSSNGTFCNDQRVQEAKLAAGDRITVGPVHFTLIIDGEPADIQQVPTVLPDDGEVESNIAPSPAPVRSAATRTAPPVTSLGDEDDDEPIAALLPVEEDDEDAPVSLLAADEPVIAPVRPEAPTEAAAEPAAESAPRPDTPHEAHRSGTPQEPVALEGLVAEEPEQAEEPHEEAFADDDPLAALAALAAGAEDGGDDDAFAQFAAEDEDDEVPLLGLDEEEEKK